MNAKFIIDNFKKSTKELNELHLLWVNSNGVKGCRCLNYEKFKERLSWTDEEILNYVENNVGLIAIDKEEYLANKKEKTN